MRNLVPAALLSGALLAAFAGQAEAATTVGQTFLPDPADSNPCPEGLTYLQSTSPGGQYTAPNAGVITAWSFHANASPPTIKLKVARSAGADSFEIVGTSQAKSPIANQLNTYTDVRISVLASDVLGFSLLSTGDCARGQQSGYDYHFASGDLAPGPAVPFAASGFYHQFDIAAVLEPDADSDGFGDESQDNCPNDPTSQCLPSGGGADTDPPQTTITKGAPNKTEKTKVKFKFTSDEPDATFECKVDTKPFKRCSSPRTLKRLDDGKHKFQVIATDEAGNTDPSAAKDKFKVVD